MKQDPLVRWLKCHADLNPLESLVLLWRLGFHGGEPKTYKECGQLLITGPGRARELECRAIRKLRHPSRSDRLAEYFLRTRKTSLEPSLLDPLVRITFGVPEDWTLAEMIQSFEKDAQEKAEKVREAQERLEKAESERRQRQKELTALRKSTTHR